MIFIIDSQRIKELLTLQNGWLDGQGKAINRQDLMTFVTKFNTLYPRELPIPYIYPTLEGNIQLEWTIEEIDISIEIELSQLIGHWHALTLETNQKTSIQLFDFNESKDWKRLISMILQTIKTKT